MECSDSEEFIERSKCECGCHANRVLDSHIPNRYIYAYIVSCRNADSPTVNEQGKLLFVKPHEEQQSFETLIDYISTQETSHDTAGEVRYGQTRPPPFPSPISHQLTVIQKMIISAMNTQLYSPTSCQTFHGLASPSRNPRKL